MKKGVVLACVIAVLSLTASVYTVVKVNNNDDKEVVTKEVTARNIMLRQADDYLQWKYDDEDNWKNLISISLLKGADGKDGKDGVDGRNGINGKDGTNGSNGTNGTNGKDGTNGVDGKNGTNGKDGTNGSNGTNGTNGKDGREVEFKVEGTKIYWKFNTATEWTLLIDVSTINEEPEEEEPGEEICETRDIIADVASVECIANGTICEPGKKVKVNVTTNTGAEPLNFYVVSDDGEKLTLILDRNIGDTMTNYVWDTTGGTAVGNNSYGPITLMNALNEYTTSWDNICRLDNYTHKNGSNENETGTQYRSLTINKGVTTITAGDGTTNKVNGVTKARVLTYDEATDENIGHCTSEDYCADWLYSNLEYTNPITKPIGYWLLDSYTSAKEADVIVLKQGGYAKNDKTATITGTNRGIRPVIEVTKPSSN